MHFKKRNSIEELMFHILFLHVGVAHGDDVFLVLDTPWMNPTMKQEDGEMQRILTDIWVSFATNG